MIVQSDPFVKSAPLIIALLWWNLLKSDSPVDDQVRLQLSHHHYSSCERNRIGEPALCPVVFSSDVPQTCSQLSKTHGDMFMPSELEA